VRLGGVTEVAHELGVSRQRVSQLRDQPGFPTPVGEIAAGQIWDLDAVHTWATSSLRGSAGRPSSGRRRILGGRYRLDAQPLGAGGFAVVYRATDSAGSSSNGAVAIKILRELEDVEVRRRFLRELRIVAALKHPHIVPVLDDGEDESGHMWYAMPLAKGSLAEEADQFRGDDERILRVMRQLCDGLGHVHAAGVFHRDLKPANVLRIAKDTWAISDFGLAREAERVTTVLTSTLQGVGTFFYAAPESWRGARFAEAEADIFSLGKVLLELVSGELPHDGARADGRFRTVVERATRSRLEDRYRSVGDMLAALESAAAAPDRWQTADEDADELAARVRGQGVDEAALLELMDRALGAHKQDDAIRALRAVIPLLKAPSVQWLWEHDPASLRELLKAYGEHVSFASLGFDFCDVVADFFELAVSVTKDDQILAIAIEALVMMGSGHNRFHVRDVVISLLQSIRTTDGALAAREALYECNESSVAWTLNDFVIRTLHPTLRDAAADILSRAE